MPDVKKLIADKTREWQPLFYRMDRDADLHNNALYVMRDQKGHIMPDVHHVTLPDASLFSARVIVILSSSLRQTVVQGDKLNDFQTTNIERFLDDFYQEIDAFLALRGKSSHDAIQWERACVRGHLGARCLIDIDRDGNLIPDITPIDPRYFYYEYGNDGMAWAAPTYRMSRASIEKEYGVKISRPIGKVDDFWNREVNEVWIDGKKQDEQENPYGYVPFIAQACPSGSMLEDENSIEHWGESIFFLARRLFAEKNRFASMMQTLTQKSFDNNMQYESLAGTDAERPEQDELNVSKVYPVDPGMGYKAMPLADTHNAARLGYAIIDGLLQKATLSDINYGTLTFPLSSLAISNLTDSKDKILISRLQLYSLYEQQLSWMIIRQFMELGIKARLGEKGHQRLYNPKMLEGDYSIQFRFFDTTKEQQIADASIANAMGDHVSEDYKRREIFKFQDPDGEGRKVTVERARRLNPVLELKDEAIALAYEGEFLNSEIVAANGVAMLKQILGGVPQLGEQPEGFMRRQGVSADVPALNEGGGGTRAPKSDVQKDRMEGIEETTAQEKETGRRLNAF